MKKRNIALSLCLTAALCVGALSSCAAAAESPFAYTVSTEIFTADDYVRTFGYKAKTLSEPSGEEYYTANVYLQYFGDEAVSVTAESFTLAVDGAEYTGAAFVSFLRTCSYEYGEGGSYAESAVTELSLGVEEIELTRLNTAAYYSVSFPLAELPAEYSLSYLGAELIAIIDGAEILSSDYRQADGVYAAAAGGKAEYCRLGSAVTEYTSVNETKINAAYSGVCLSATVGNEAVSVYANKFTLKLDDKEYTCLGFAESSSYTDENGLLTVHTQTVKLTDTALLRSEEISKLYLSFDVAMEEGYALYYNGVKL